MESFTAGDDTALPVPSLPEPLLKAKKLVDQLYQYRDSYYTTIKEDENASGTKRDSDIAEKLKVEILPILSEIQGDCERIDRALFYMLKGRALNIESSYNQEAFDLLSKSVKFNPKLTGAWNELGECYWKKGDIQSAKNCFQNSLNYNKKDKVALRSLSMLLRQLKGQQSPDEQKEMLIQSLKLAKDAVQVDLMDGISWYILGNAYLTMFFLSVNQDANFMKQARVAYEKAQKDIVACSHADYWFNFASLTQYEENYSETIEYLRQTVKLDPEWSDPKERLSSLMAYLREVGDIAAKKKTPIKPKKLQTLIQELKKNPQLGPFKEFKVITVDEIQTWLRENAAQNPRKFNRLTGKVFNGKVIVAINADNSSKNVNHTFLAIDSEENCAAINVYNLALGKGPRIGDSVAISDPFVKMIEIHGENDFSDAVIKYISIRVDNPLDLIVRGQRLSVSNLARPQIDNQLRRD